MDREKIVDYLKKQIDKHIVFDSVPENDEGWHEVKRESVYKIVDGLIPLIKSESKKDIKSAKQQLLQADVSGRSEQLLDFCYWLNANRIGDIKEYLDIKEVEDYLKSSNCH